MLNWRRSRIARANLRAAGLLDYVSFVLGDARTTLAGLKGRFVPVESRKALAEKIVRGAVYALDHQFVEADTEIIVLPPMPDEDARPLINTINRSGRSYSLGPGFRFGRAEGFFANQISGQLWIYGYLRSK